MLNEIAHNSLWGSHHTENNGTAVEEMIDEKSLVCLYDGRGTEVNLSKKFSLLSRLISWNMVNGCEWNVKKETIVECSLPNLMYHIHKCMCTRFEYTVYGGWCFEKAD